MIRTHSLKTVLLLIAMQWNFYIDRFDIDHFSFPRIFFSVHTVCSRYSDAVRNHQPPHVILDTTITGTTSETVKSFAASMGLPTVSASFGQEGNIRQWRDLDEKKRNYLLQIMPPVDVIPEVLRSIIKFMNISNAAILHDESFGMPCWHLLLIRTNTTAWSQ